MPEFVIEIYTKSRYKGRFTAATKDEAKNQVWEQLEEIGPEEIAELQQAYVGDVRVRYLYDWEVPSDVPHPGAD